ncbi:hypothetical protein EDD85DRAFT_140576 [Armillaria nabsnona]|nr:hypothetical protein EDD85DRAFT_140576 [Armillaria nabsnona]
MGNTPSRILRRLLFGAVKSILNRFRSVFLTARTAKDSPPDATSNSDHNSNTASHSESQEAILQPNNNSIPADSLLPVVDPELTDPFASPKRPSERLSSLPSQNHSVAEQSDSLLLVADTELTDPFSSPRRPCERLSSLRSQNHSAAEQSHSDCSDDPNGGLFAYEVDNGFPEITITAFTETGQAESSIKVPEQRSYTSTWPVIPSSLANTPCAALGIPGLLDLFNTTLVTSHTLETPSLSSVFEDCIKNNYDFGTAFGRLRAVWSADNISTIQNELRRVNGLYPFQKTPTSTSSGSRC